MRSALARIIAGTVGLVILFGVIAETAPYLRALHLEKKWSVAMPQTKNQFALLLSFRVLCVFSMRFVRGNSPGSVHC